MYLVEQAHAFAWCAASIFMFMLIDDVMGRAKNLLICWLCLMIGLVPLFISAAFMLAEVFGSLISVAVITGVFIFYEAAVVRKFFRRERSGRSVA